MSTMVTLTNVTKKDNIVYAEYFPEGNEKDIGKIVYNIEKKEVIEKKYCELDEKSYLKSYFKKSIKALKECVENNDFPKEKVLMWY